MGMSRTLQPELAAIIFAHSGRPRVIRLPVSLRPSSRSGTWREFRLDQPCLGIKVASASPAVGAVRNLLSEPRHAPGLCFYSMYIGAGGEKQESHWARQRQRLSYLMPHAG